MKERESFRERESDSLGREGSQLATNGKGWRKDFREGLVSIFVDNLNPVVDNGCLWGVFKPFGKVRDVYLSSKINGRGSRFAFIRFGTRMEALKVVKLTNGMHIYGWPVVTKVAAHDWNQRRTMARIEDRRAYLGSSSEEARVDERPRFSHMERWSYAEVVDGNKQKDQGRFIRDKNVVRDDKVVVMSWDGSKYEDGWIERCAVGILKDFSGIQSVNKRLCNRDFSFSSRYLGDKSIVWEFESEIERDGFIKNRFFWDDCFSSMGKWTDSDVPKSRLVWVNVLGVPLRCWSDIFFKKIGWSLGEPVLLAEETKNRRRIDQGRILVLIAHGYVCPRKIRVEEGTSSFEVMIEEDGNPEFSWLENFLGLKMITTHASSILFPGKESPACFSVQDDDPVPGPSLSKARDDKISALKKSSRLSPVGSNDSDLDVNASKEGMENNQVINYEMIISKDTTGSSFSNKSIGGGVDVRKECPNCFSKLSMVNNVGELSNSDKDMLVLNRIDKHMGESQQMKNEKGTRQHMGERRNDHVGEGTKNEILKPTKASVVVGSNVGYVGETENREREKCNLVGTSDLGSLGSFESVSSKRRSVRVFDSKDGSCGGVGVSGNQVVYINFEEGKDLKEDNFDDPAIDLFVDLGGLKHFGRKGNMGDSVDSLCSSVARRSNKNFFPTRSHRMKTRSGARGIDFNAVDDVVADQCVKG